MKNYILLSIFVALSIASFSSPTIYGPTGLIEMPTAESIAYKQINVAVDYSVETVAVEADTDNVESTDETESTNVNQIYYKFNLGSFENWEIGVLGGTFLDEGVFVNLKYFLMSNQQANPLSIAAGCERIGSNEDLSTYLVASKRFDGGLNMHFGFKAYVQNYLYAAAMFGGEYYANDKVAFLVDITGERTMSYVLNSGIRLFLDQDVSLRIYVVDITKSREAEETTYTFGLSISKFM